MTKKEQQAKKEQEAPAPPPLLKFYSSLSDLAFEEPLKNIGEALYIISQSAFADSSSSPYELVPTKLQVFKEKQYAKSNTKFGFVEFHLSLKKKNDSNNNDNNQKSNEKEQEQEGEIEKEKPGQEVEKMMSLSEEMKLKLLEKIDKVLTTALPTFKFSLTRIPEDILSKLESSKLVKSSKDSAKVQALIAMRINSRKMKQDGEWKLPTTTSSASSTSASSSTTTTTATAAASSTTETSPSSPTTTTTTTMMLPITDMLLLRQELPDLFPKTATTENIETFFQEMLPGFV